MNSAASDRRTFFPVFLGTWIGALAGAALLWATFGNIRPADLWTVIEIAARPEYSSPQVWARWSLDELVGVVIVGAIGGSVIGAWGAHRLTERLPSPPPADPATAPTLAEGRNKPA